MMWGKGPSPTTATTSSTATTSGRASPVSMLAYVPAVPPSSRSHHAHSQHRPPLFLPPIASRTTTTDHSYSSFPTQRWHSTDQVNENHRGLRLRASPLLSSNGNREPDDYSTYNVTSSSSTSRAQRVMPSEPLTVRSFPATTADSTTSESSYGLTATTIPNEMNNGKGESVIIPETGAEFSPTLSKNDLHRDEGSSSLAAKTKNDYMISSVLLLNLVAIIWGTQHAVIKWVLMDSPAAPFTLLRFTLAALVASPYTPGLMANQASAVVDDEKGHTSATTISPTWRWGAEMGMWMFLGFSFQAIGLEYTTAQRSGFLLYLNVKLVPFFARFLLGRRVSKATWISAVAAFSGTALLALDNQSSSIGFNVGDVWTIAAAACSAMFILRLETASQKVPQSAQLNAACLWVVTLLAAIWTFVGDDSSTTTLAAIVETAKTHPWEVIYLGGVTTALANYIQTRAQKDISPERASVIYSMDPVYGSFFAWLILGETLGGPQAILGASLITVAAATNAFLDFGQSSSSSSSSDKCNDDDHDHDHETSGVMDD